MARVIIAALFTALSAAPAFAAPALCEAHDTIAGRTLLAKDFSMEASTPAYTAARKEFHAWIKKNYRGDFMEHNVSCAAYNTEQRRAEKRAHYESGKSVTGPVIKIDWAPSFAGSK
jgi:hypothetical protein